MDMHRSEAKNQPGIRLFAPTGAYWHPPCLNSTNFAYAVLVADKLYAFPYKFPKGIPALDRYGIEVRTGAAAGKKMRFGWASSKNGKATAYPDALIRDSGELAADSSAVKIDAYALAPQPNVLYWFLITSDGNPEIRCAALTEWCFPAPADFNSFYTGYRADVAFAALPANFPAGATFAYSLGNQAPRVGFRIA